MFFSAHARDDALAEDLVEPDRASVVHIGVDHAFVRRRSAPRRRRARGAARCPTEAEVMLCIGTDFRHKNRMFALRMLEQLQRRHDWHGHLVFVGPARSPRLLAATRSELLARSPSSPRR